MPDSSTAAPFTHFAEVCEQLVRTTRKLEKRALLADYLRSLLPRDAALAALYLAGQPFPATDRRQLNIGGSLLSRVLSQVSGASEHRMHAAYLRHGDLGGAAEDLLNEAKGRRPVAPTLTLQEVEAAFAAIADAAKPLARQHLVSALFERSTPLECKYLIKIALGDMRTGVKESLVEEAIAAAFEAEIAQVRRTMMLQGSLAEVVTLAAEHRLNQATMKLFHPLGFMLASPVETVDEALRRFSESQTGKDKAGGPEEQSIASMGGAQLEDKYDGIRAQVHCGDPAQPGRVALFSRSREDMTASFPELVEAFARFSQPLILDGEILAWDPTGSGDEEEPLDPAPQADSISAPALSRGRALPFTSLQPRVGRKVVSARMRESAPVVFMAFDLLYYEGELMIERPLAERRRALEELVERGQERTRVGSVLLSGDAAPAQSRLQFEDPEEREEFPRLLLAPAVELKSAAQLEQAYLDARARGNEGAMLKARRSLYQPGRRGLAWLKLKRELATLDVVVTAAEYGHGKRAGSLSDYTFAVRDGDTLRNVGKAYSGLTDHEIATLTRFFLEHTLEDFGSLRSVEPLVVLEVAFNNVMRSDRHNSGYALRFPRIVRIRGDKPVAEIDTLDRVAEIYHSQISHTSRAAQPEEGST